MSDRDKAKQLFYQAVDLIDQEQFAAAEQLLRDADRLAPDVAPVVTNLAVALYKQNLLEEAAERARDAIALEEDNSEARIVLGNSLSGLRRFADAVAEFDAVLVVHPEDIDAWLGRSKALAEAGNFEDAYASYERALKLDPHSAEAWTGRAGILAQVGRLTDAVTAYSEALAANPNARYILGETMFTKLLACDWRGLAADWTAMSAGIAADKPVSQAFQLLCAPLTPAEQHRAIVRIAGTMYPPIAPALWNGERYKHDRIRIAYLSADYHDHPTAHLTSGLFEHHDRSQFEVFGISYGPDDGGAERRRLRQGFEHFIDVRARSDREIAAYIHDNEIDIAVDLKGLTTDGRPSILASRPAPVQVNYLGFPGTLGAPYYDYILGDAIVTPAKHQPYFAERIVTLPHSYMVNDDKRPISDAPVTRGDMDLPPTGVVFCCFNHPNKITPAVFEVWVRLLKNVEGSVLWLYGANDAAPDNLRREAAKRGIAPDRLVFAPRVPLAKHLARYRLADLFLDTQPYNAHTTASDALWAGLPVLTAHGETFASRVAASLLTAAGLPELVKSSLADYESAALRLAQSPGELAAIRFRLAELRDRTPLFDTARFARNVESAYRTMFERTQRGLPPEPFEVVEKLN